MPESTGILGYILPSNIGWTNSKTYIDWKLHLMYYWAQFQRKTFITTSRNTIGNIKPTTWRHHDNILVTDILSFHSEIITFQSTSALYQQLPTLLWDNTALKHLIYLSKYKTIPSTVKRIFFIILDLTYSGKITFVSRGGNPAKFDTITEFVFLSFVVKTWIKCNLIYHS